jgi:hypothetical protein
LFKLDYGALETKHLLSNWTSSHHAQWPPSILRSALVSVTWKKEDVYPVIKLLPLPAKKTVAARYSSGIEIRPNGL